MAKAIEYDGEYIVGGRPASKVTPNFSLKEYTSGGKVFVARELVAGVQEVRETHGAAVSIASLAPAEGLGAERRGCFAWLKATDPDGLERAATEVRSRDGLARVQRAGNRLYVECVDPDNPPPLAAESAVERGIRATAAFQTSGDPFQQVTGNFDKAGLSFGPLQVNFGTGTLQALFARFATADTHALAACFGNPDHWAEWQGVLAMSRPKQIAWADARSTGANKYGFAEPWRGYLQAVGRVPSFRTVMMDYAYDVYGRKLIVALSWLKGLWPGRIDDFRCLSALYDLCVQQGSLDKAHDAIRRRVLREAPADQLALMHIAVEERGKTANTRWRADCVSRRLGILYRGPQRVTIAGNTAERGNPRLYLVRKTTVKGAEKFLG